MTEAYELDTETVLFVEHTGQLLRLNPTAAVIWRGLESGLAPSEITAAIVRASDAPADVVKQDVAALIQQLDQASALKDAAPSAARPRQVAPQPAYSVPAPGDRSYCLAGFQFNVRTASPAIAEAAFELLGHVSTQQHPAPLFELSQDGGTWRLSRDGELLDRCTTSAGVIPMLHAHVLLAAYRNSNCMAGLHAAAVIRDNECILMPAASGSGKSTLTAALVAHGYGYGTDDLTLLTGDPVRVVPVPTCLGFKPGSWKALDTVLPEILQLPVHLRSDGRLVRYWAPPAAALPAPDETFAVRAIVFPVWSHKSGLRMRPLSSAEGLTKLASSGYDLPNRINRASVQTLIRWISGVPCFELCYDKLENAVAEISKVLP